MDPESFHLLMGALKTIAQVLKVNEEDSHALLSDDMLIWFRNLGFVKDERFKKACEGFESSAFIRAKLYRVYIYCWAINEAWCVGYNADDKVCVDLGTYDGKTVQIADRYMHGMLNWTLYDAFDHHPAQENKEKHGAALMQEVSARMPHAKVVSGTLPDSLLAHEKISFVHVDLNNAEAEISCLDKLWDAILDDGVILLDDYGWSKYQDSYDRHNAFFRSKGQSVLELPTGQGLVIKR